jgi:ubiquinone/menaquinone biosynthesis C-methylase UbiE
MQPASASQQHVSDYFESTAVYWQTLYSDDGLSSTIYQDRHNTALTWIRDLNLVPSARILEVGCGAGLVTSALARSGYTVDALDSTTAMLQMTGNDAARHRVQDRIRMYAADVHALPFQAHTFDLVIAIGVIPWLHSEHLALQEMRRVLKHDGHLLVTADNNARLNRILDPLSSPASAPFRVVAKRVLRLCGLWSPQPGFQPKRHYPREFSRSIGDCGFERVKSRTVGFGPFTFLGKAILADAIGIRVHRWLQTMASGRGAFPLRWTGAHYLVLAIRT